VPPAAQLLIDRSRQAPDGLGSQELNMARKIVVGYDGSKAGKKAFDVALDLASEQGAELFVISVALAPGIPGDVESKALVDYSLHHRRQLLNELEPHAATKGVKALFEVLQGRAAEQIICYADRHDADLIVVGNRGYSKLARLVFGSVSKKVTENTARSVLVVR
jgi:nucleotide-binding universal stress UspA family protein